MESSSTSTKSNLVYFSISDQTQTLYSYNGGDQTLQALAAVCLQNTPPFHSHYFHTTGNRTFGYLIDSSFTFFAILDHHDAANITDSVSFLKILNQIKKAFLEDQIASVVKKLITSLESMRKSNESTNSDAVKIDIAEDKEKRMVAVRDGKEVWRKHVKIVVFLDVALCLCLFGIWLGVCKGVDCIRNR